MEDKILKEELYDYFCSKNLITLHFLVGENVYHVEWS